MHSNSKFNDNDSLTRLATPCRDLISNCGANGTAQVEIRKLETSLAPKWQWTHGNLLVRSTKVKVVLRTTASKTPNSALPK